MRNGDIVKCAKTVVGSKTYNYLTVSNEYIVLDATIDKVQVAEPSRPHTALASGHWYLKEAFELVDKTNAVDLNLKGKVLARKNHTVVIELDTGETVVLPEHLAPIDPKVLKFRDVFSDFLEAGLGITDINAGTADMRIADIIRRHSL